LTLLDFHPEEVARQMTLLDHKLFAQVPLHEFLKNKQSSASKLGALINHFNLISGWVSTEVLQANDIEQRLILIHRFLIIITVPSSRSDGEKEKRNV
jgi:hypothetical protein